MGKDGSQAMGTTTGRMKPEPDSKPEPEHTTTQEDARGLRLSCVRLTQTQSWCYHEGSYGYNPEYGSTHILTLASSANATHTKTDHNDGSNFNKTAAAGVTTFWKIRTGGQSTLPDREHRPHLQRQAERRQADRHGQLPRDGGDEDGGALRRRAISAVRRGRERALGAIQGVIVVCPLSFVRLAMDQFFFYS